MACCRLVSALAILIIVFTNVTDANASGCRRPSPEAGFRSEIKSTEYVRTESVNDLTQWQAGHSIMAKKVLGVGGGSVGTKLRARYEMIPQEDNLYCVTPVAVDAVFYAAPQIHVASNFARGSCEYSEVLAHEQKHITVLRKFYREYRDGYKDFFRQTARTLPAPIAVPLEDVEAEKKKTTALIMEELNGYTQEMMDELNKRQRAVDTLDEYERVIAKCDNWEKNIPAKKR